MKNPDGFRAALKRGSKLAEAMAVAADMLNATIKQAEEAITALKLGVSAGILINEPEQEGFEQILGFRKDGGRWRLQIESGPLNAGDPADWTVNPLVNCSRETRVRAVGALPALVERLVEVGEQQLQDVLDATQFASNFAATISDGGKK